MLPQGLHLFQFTILAQRPRALRRDQSQSACLFPLRDFLSTHATPAAAENLRLNGFLQLLDQRHRLLSSLLSTFSGWQTELQMHTFRLISYSFLDLKSLSNASRVCKAFSKARWLYIDASSLRGHLYAVDLAFFIRKQPKVLIVPKLLGSVGAGQALNGFRGDMLELSYSRLHFEANIFFTANSLQVGRQVVSVANMLTSG